AMSPHRRFVLNRRRFVTSLVGLGASVPLLRASSVAQAADLFAAPAAISASAQATNVLIDARTTEAAGLDPHNVPALANFRVTHLLYEGLTWLDTNLQVQPLLPESREIQNPTTHAFHLRKVVRFHTGRELDAEAVKATVERVL